VVGQGEQADHCASGVAHGTGREESFPCAPVSGARPEGVAIGQIGQCARFGAQSGDDVTVIDDMDRYVAAFGPASAGQSENEGAAEIRLDAVVMDPRMQTMTDLERYKRRDDTRSRMRWSRGPSSPPRSSPAPRAEAGGRRVQRRSWRHAGGCAGR